MKHWTDKLKLLPPCGNALAWCQTQPNASVAWKNCQNVSWMLWLIGETTKSDPWSEERTPLVRVAIECAKLAEPYLNNDSRLAFIWCVDATERWCNGEAEQDEVEAARSAAYAATAAAAATAATAAAAAAYAAAAAAYAAAAAAAATTADAYAAVYAAAATAAAAAADAAYAVRIAIRSQCVNIVRAHFPKAPVLP